MATVDEEPPHVLDTHGCCKCSTHRLDEDLLGSGADLPEEVLDLRESFLYGVPWSGE
jgi:hypothetical protein